MKRAPVANAPEAFRAEFPGGNPWANQAMRNLVRLSDVLVDAVNRRLRVHGLHLATAQALSVLEGADHALTPHQIGEHLHLTSGTVTTVIDSLEKRGLVERRPHPEDRRKVLVSITDAGRAVLDRPLGVVGVVTAALAVYLGRGYPGGPVYVTLFVALYSLATSRGRRSAFATAAVSSGSLVVVGEVAGTGPGLVHLVFVGWAAAAVFLGDAVRSRRGYLAALEERAVHLEQSREEEARRRVAEERLRIAQDLHDSVAHSMAIINVQAGVAAHVIDRHPDRAHDALVVIQQASAEVLDELAALLGLLRPRDGEAAALAPTPGADQLGSLVESSRRSGLEVALRVERDLDDVPQPLGVALYRIVQESLTNVVRHAGHGARATVTVGGDPGGRLSVEVADDGGGLDAASGGAGVGIVGMKERAQATGGSLEAKARPDGGFVVRAVWPARP